MHASLFSDSPNVASECHHVLCPSCHLGEIGRLIPNIRIPTTRKTHLQFILPSATSQIVPDTNHSELVAYRYWNAFQNNPSRAVHDNSRSFQV